MGSSSISAIDSIASTQKWFSVAEIHGFPAFALLSRNGDEAHFPLQVESIYAEEAIYFSMSGSAVEAFCKNTKCVSACYVSCVNSIISLRSLPCLVYTRAKIKKLKQFAGVDAELE